MRSSLEKFGNHLLSACAGMAAFIFTLFACIWLRNLDEKLAASLTIGLLAVMIVWVASERPSNGHARAVRALIDRLLAVGTGDLESPTPLVVRQEMPTLASAVDNLFGQVRSNLENVHAMAMYDPVTSLPNRLHFKREAERLLAEQGGREAFALLFIDLDGFKEVNDNLGHAQGDKVLAMVANRLRIVVKAETEPGSLIQPLIARLAGDEFTILLPVADQDEAERIARRTSIALSDSYDNAEQRIEMGASIGIALAPEHGEDLTTLMKAADIAMYHAKASGRSQVCLYRPALAEAFEARAQTDRMLRRGLADGEFEMFYQPEICARTGAIVAGEALLRWNHPDGRMRTPESFIAAAEESRVIVDIGEWVIEDVAATLARWRDLGMTQRLAFNISPRQLERPTFFRKLHAAMERNGAPPWLLELEFTETLAMKCGKTVIAELATLRELGATIAIDDFGSGYSNLARLKDMPLDRVKIDRSIVADVDRSEGARTIVSAVIHLIHGIGCEVICEGVERQEQIDVLRAIGCDTFQGFAFSAAMPEQEFLRWVAERESSADAERLSRTA